MTDYGDMFPGEGDESEIGVCIPVLAGKSAIPKHLRGGGKA